MKVFLLRDFYESDDNKDYICSHCLFGKDDICIKTQLPWDGCCSLYYSEETEKIIKQYFGKKGVVMIL